MRKVVTIILALMTLALSAQEVTLYRSGTFLLGDQNDSLNYFLGLSLGYDMKNAPFEVDPKLVAAGLNEAYAKEPLYTKEATMEIVTQLRAAVMAAEEAKAGEAAEVNLTKGQEFLEKNGQREGVVTTASGLQYEFLIRGEGAIPADTSTVTVHYEGSLIDGTTFDSSYERGEPVSFPLNGVIRGWTEGLQLVPVGSKVKLYIPSELAYGPRNSGPIPANSVLIFVIELLDIE